VVLLNPKFEALGIKMGHQENTRVRYTSCFNSNLSSSLGGLWIIFNVFQKAFDFNGKGIILNTILIKYDYEGICHEELPITFKFECIQVQI
jgi:hypothetical protein